MARLRGDASMEIVELKIMIYYTYTISPVEKLMLTSDGKSLTGLFMVEQRYSPAMDTNWVLDDTAAPFAEAKRQLTDYFAGRLSEFTLPLRLDGTAFQQRVWEELQKIPFGATISYGELAQRIGNPKGSRAVGLANGRNPISIIVPCHRVIGASGSLTGYGGGLNRKQWLLAHERHHSGQQQFDFA